MRKFAFLLALVAMLAFAGTAFADWDAKDVKSLAQDDGAAIQNMGAVTETKTPSHDTSAVNGGYAAKVYYFDKIDGSNNATAGVKLTAGTDNSAAQFIYGVNYAGKEDFGGTAAAATRTGAITLDSTTEATYRFGVANITPDDFDDAQVQATLTLTPVKIELEIPGPIRIAEGTEETEVKIKLKNEGLTPHFSGDGFKADSPSDVSPTITPGRDGLVINAGNADPGTYVFEVKTQPVTSMTIDEPSGATGITVANFPTGEDRVCEMTVIIVGYEVTPSSADWDSRSPERVKFKVDMKYDDFNGVGLKKPSDTEGTDIANIGDEFYTVTPTADGIEIEIKLEYLVEHLTENGEYVFNVADKDNRQAYFTLRVTIDPENNVPATGVDPLDEDAQKGPPGIEYGIAQIRLNADRVKELLPSEMREAVDADGRIKTDEAARLTRADPDTLTVKPTVATTFDFPDSIIAPFTFNVKGTELVSEEVDGIRWYDAIIHKMFVRDDGPASVRLAPARTFDAIKNGTFMIMVEVNDEYDKPVGRLLSADYVIERDDKQYKLVVFIEDDKDYDLDKTPRTIVDPVAVQESSGGSGSSSGCEMGAGLAAIAGLAAAAIKRRKR